MLAPQGTRVQRRSDGHLNAILKTLPKAMEYYALSVQATRIALPLHLTRLVQYLQMDYEKVHVKCHDSVIDFPGFLQRPSCTG
jgi:hypothetical protein